MNTARQAIDFLDSLYQVEQSTEDWVAGMLRTSLGSLNLGGGVGCVRYALGENGGITMEGLNGLGHPDGFLEVGLTNHADPSLTRAIHHAYRTWPLCLSFQPFLETVDANTRAVVEQRYAECGISDQLILNAHESSGTGIVLFVFARNRICLTPLRKSLLSRIAVHLSTAYRLRRRLALLDASPSPAEAVLEPSGRVAHAELPAQGTEAREELGAAVQRREWARARRGSDEPDTVLEGWRGLVRTRWTLVDQLERDGKRFILARENEPAPRGLAALSGRERQVAALAALGRSNKLIAYELGLAHSTVRVLMVRAARKLGVRSRADLVKLIGTSPPSA